MPSTQATSSTAIVVCNSAVKKHNAAVDSKKRYYVAYLGAASSPTLKVIITPDKFATDTVLTLDSQKASSALGGGTGCKVRPYDNHFAMFIDSADFIHIYWKQLSNSVDLVADDVYHMYGKINSFGNITWQPIQLVRTSSVDLFLGDMVAFVVPDDTDYMTCLFVVARRDGTNSYVHFHRHKFQLSTPSNYLDNGSTVCFQILGDSDSLRPVMTFRQATNDGDEKTPHATAPHVYIVAASPAAKTEWIRGTYSVAGDGWGFWTFGSNNIRTTRYASGLVSGAQTWHQILWADGSPWFVGCVTESSGGLYMALNRMDAISTAKDGSDFNLSTSFVTDGVAIWDPDTNQIKMFGVSNVTAHDLDRIDCNVDTGVFSFINEDVDSLTDNFPDLTMNRALEFGYSILAYRRKSGSQYQLRVSADHVTTNHAPDTPQNVDITSGVSDTTPDFTADLADTDLLDQVKLRIKIYDAAGSTLLQTRNTGLQTVPVTVTPSLTTPLSPGSYKYTHEAIDDDDASSGESSQVAFSIQGTYSKDFEIQTDVSKVFSTDFTLQTDVEASTTRDFTLVTDVGLPFSQDFQLILDIDTGWIPIDEVDPDTVWTEVEDAPLPVFS